MSEIIQGADEPIDETVDAAEEAVETTSDKVGSTSEESSERKSSLLETMTIFDAMLLISLICAVTATLILFFELRDFGNFPFSFPWRTN